MHFVLDGHCHFVNKLPIGSLSRRSRSDADYARPQSNGPAVRYRRNVDIYSGHRNSSTHGRGVTDISRWRESAPRAAAPIRFDQASSRPIVVHVHVEITISITRTIRASFPNVSRLGYFGHPPDCGNDESTTPYIA